MCQAHNKGKNGKADFLTIKWISLFQCEFSNIPTPVTIGKDKELKKNPITPHLELEILQSFLKRKSPRMENSADGEDFKREILWVLLVHASFNRHCHHHGKHDVQLYTNNNNHKISRIMFSHWTFWKGRTLLERDRGNLLLKFQRENNHFRIIRPNNLCIFPDSYQHFSIFLLIRPMEAES